MRVLRKFIFNLLELYTPKAPSLFRIKYMNQFFFSSILLFKKKKDYHRTEGYKYTALIPFLPLFDWVLKILAQPTLDAWINPLSHFYFIWNQYINVSTLYAIEFFYCIKFQCIIDYYNFRTYYFYEFGRDNQHVALMAGVSSGKVCYYKHFKDINITNPSTYT